MSNTSHAVALEQLQFITNRILCCKINGFGGQSLDVLVSAAVASRYCSESTRVSVKR